MERKHKLSDSNSSLSCILVKLIATSGVIEDPSPSKSRDRNLGTFGVQEQPFIPDTVLKGWNHCQCLLVSLTYSKLTLVVPLASNPNYKCSFYIYMLLISVMNL